MKPIRFHKSVEKEIKNWPEPTRMQLSDLLALLAVGEMLGMPVSRPMPSVGSSVHELRIKDRSGQYRTFYYLKHKEAVLVFHSFKKKTQTTPQHEIEVGRQRLKDML